MQPNLFWKNFRLGTELQISGSFIYNGLFTLENMQTFYHQEECFEFLYNISVGLERLAKVAVILIEHDDTISQEEYEKTLITHMHPELIRRIKEKRKLTLNKEHNKFLTLLGEFYRSSRYDRYNLSSVYNPPQDQEKLVKFIADQLNIEIKIALPFSTEITDDIRAFFGKLIAKIATQLFELVREEAYRLGIATYELAYDSKAFKIFVAKEFDFKKERLMQREVLLYLLKDLPDEGFKEYIDTLKPIPFGQLDTNKYVQSIFNIHRDRDVVDEMEYLYEEHNIKKERVDTVMPIGSDNISFDPIDEDFETE